MKFLDIDALTTESQKVVKIGGVEHPIVERSIEQIINSMKAEEKLEKGTEEERLVFFVDMVHACLPTVDKEKLRNMPMSHLNAIMEFISGTEVVETTEQGKK